MKNKIIKTTLISLLLTSSISLISASENTFYLKPYVSGVMGDKMTSSSLTKTYVLKPATPLTATDYNAEDPENATQTKLQAITKTAHDLNNIYSEYGANLGIAAGYNILEHVRVEAELSYINNIEYKGTGNKIASSATAGNSTVSPPVLATAAKSEPATPTMSHTGWTTYINGYVDIVNTGPVRFFMSGGLGVSYLETKIGDYTISKEDQHTELPGAANAPNIIEEPEDIVFDGTYEQEMDFAYNLGLGVSFELNENYLLDVSYKYNNYGKPGSDANGTEWAYDSRASHNLNLGLRFNL
jgi:opacity protein-like surface antigen